MDYFHNQFEQFEYVFFFHDSLEISNSVRIIDGNKFIVNEEILSGFHGKYIPYEKEKIIIDQIIINLNDYEDCNYYQVKNRINTMINEGKEKLYILRIYSKKEEYINYGEKIFKKCAACHSIVNGGKNKIGPALYNVVGRKIGIVEDYKYSKALASYDKEWTVEELNGYLIKPAKWIKGTKMAFAGLRKEKDRASVIKYLNQNSDNPLQLP